MPFIQSIGLAKATHKYKQKDILQFILDMYTPQQEDKQKIERLYDRSDIEYRYSVLDDFAKPKHAWSFFNADKPSSTEKRMNLYAKLAPKLGKEAVEALFPVTNLKNITHLLTVSCTGMSAPGLDIQLMQELNLPVDTHRSSINFMGCYAALHALKSANDICKSNPKAQVLIVLVELCTLHFQNDYSMENVASSLLFADGAAAVIVSNNDGPLELLSFYSAVALHGKQDMAWKISSTGFLMNLSAYVPDIIAQTIKPTLQTLLVNNHLTLQDVSYWAIHPGGKKIILEVQQALALDNDDLAASRQVLRQYGNMSSVTILFVLAEILAKKPDTNKLLLSCAFGPGLTTETMLLRT